MKIISFCLTTQNLDMNGFDYKNFKIPEGRHFKHENCGPLFFHLLFALLTSVHTMYYLVEYLQEWREFGDQSSLVSTCFSKVRVPTPWSKKKIRTY